MIINAKKLSLINLFMDPFTIILLTLYLFHLNRAANGEEKFLVDVVQCLKKNKMHGSDRDKKIIESFLKHSLIMKNR